MRRLRRKNANKELSALARLNDRAIDTSEIPEIKDWSNAIVGRFYKSGEQRIFPRSLNAGTFAGNVLVELESANIQRADATEITELTTGEIVKACIKGTPEAWSEFIRRFHRLIAAVVTRTSRQWGVQSPENSEEFIQEVYLRLWADDFRLLRTYQEDHESAFLGYVKRIAANVVHDHLRRVGSHMLEASAKAIYEVNDAAKEAPGTASSQERKVFFDEIDRILKATASEDERVIFWLHYQHGLTASEIAATPTTNLTAKGVESLLRRLRGRIKAELTKQDPKHHRP